MSPRGVEARIEDILEGIRNVQSYVQGMTFEEFAADMKTVRAAAFEVGTIGEAARHTPDEVRKHYPQVPWDKMQATRNLIFHEYFRIDKSLLWQTITDDLPSLVPVLQEILDRER